LRGKCTQRNFWMGDINVDSVFGTTFPESGMKASLFFSAKN